jgi:hypothetical protein
MEPVAEFRAAGLRESERQPHFDTDGAPVHVSGAVTGSAPCSLPCGVVAKRSTPDITALAVQNARSPVRVHSGIDWTYWHPREIVNEMM